MCHYAECPYAGYHYAECRGAKKMTLSLFKNCYFGKAIITRSKTLSDLAKNVAFFKLAVG